MCLFNGNTTCSGVSQISSMPAGIQLCLRGQIPRTWTASIKTFFSAQIPADRNVTSMPTIWAAAGVQCALLNMGSPQGRPGSIRKETEVSRSSPGSGHTLRGTQHRVAECSICFKNSRLHRIPLSHSRTQMSKPLQGTRKINAP